MKEEVRLYIGCMADVKLRADHIRESYAVRAHEHGVAQMDFEAACLQLRMIIELIAFASLASNRELYENVWSGYRKHNDFSVLTKRLRQINPRFLPTSVLLQGRDARGVTQMIDASDQLDVDRLVSAHGKLGNVLHAHNPYRPKLPIAEQQELLRSMTKHLIRCLQNHVAILSSGEHLLVSMKGNNESIGAYLLKEPA
jgi:hypothetical protein